MSKIGGVLRAAFGSYYFLAFIAMLAVGLSVYAEVSTAAYDVFGESARTVGRVITGVVTGALGLFWLLVTPKIAGRPKSLILACLVVAAVGVVASIRRVNFTGNNHLVIDWRWSPTNDEVVAQSGRFQDKGDTVLADLPESMLEGPAYVGFLGPGRDGHLDSPPLTQDWASHPPKELWRSPIGAGYSAYAIKGSIAVTLEQFQDAERVTACNARTGEVLWVHSYPAFFQETMGGDGPRASPAIDGDDVISLGATGVLCRLELLTGKVVWKVNILEDAETKNVEWGMSGSPLVLGDIVVVNPGGNNNFSLAAYDKETGKLIWHGGDLAAAYSSPIVGTLRGEPTILSLGRDAIAAYDPTDGSVRWRHPFVPFNGINVAQPLPVGGDRVFLSASYGAGCTMLEVNKDDDGKWSVEERWHNNNLRCKFTSPFLEDNFLYGLDDGILVCVDVETGKRKWKKGRFGHGQIVRVGPQIVVMAETGEVVIVDVDPKKYVERTRWKALPGEKTWNAPALAGDLLLVRNHLEAAAYQLALDAPADAVSARD